MINKQCIGNRVVGLDLGISCSIILEFTERDWGRLRKSSMPRFEKCLSGLKFISVTA
jgi:hypothetical protein